MTSVPKGPWFVRDFRAVKMRSLGWTGPSIDRILITNLDAKGVAESNGENCVIARIQFDNRPEEMDDGNLADARLIAAAPDLYAALAAIMSDPRGKGIDPEHRRQAHAALAKAQASS